MGVFESARLAGLSLPNRITRPATHGSMADAAGAPTPWLELLYTALAKGRTGAILTGYAGVHLDGKSSLPGMLMMNEDRLVPAFRTLTDEVHRHWIPILLQITHCGRQTRSAVTGLPTVSPPSPEGFHLQRRDSEGTWRAGHRNRRRQFRSCSPASEKGGFRRRAAPPGTRLSAVAVSFPLRQPEEEPVGGSLQNRFRIVSEILNRIRPTEDDFPILAKINAYDRRPGGMRPKEALKAAQLLEAAGCDAVEISSGTVEEGLSIMRGPNPPVEALFSSCLRFRNLPGPVKALSAPLVKLAIRSPQPLRNNNFEAAKAIRKTISIPVIRQAASIHRKTSLRQSIPVPPTVYPCPGR
jgi:2,4-dienoyl-CoA reductase-like NADH-dependent reductase (Old Yellow Enzyme family)